MCKDKTHRQNQEPLKNKELAEAEIKMDIDYFSGSTLLFPFYKVTYKVISIISYFLLALRVPTRGTQKTAAQMLKHLSLLSMCCSFLLKFGH